MILSKAKLNPTCNVNLLKVPHTSHHHLWWCPHKSRSQRLHLGYRTMYLHPVRKIRCCAPNNFSSHITNDLISNMVTWTTDPHLKPGWHPGQSRVRILRASVRIIVGRHRLKIIHLLCIKHERAKLDGCTVHWMMG